jgi:hypothetical protein
VARISDLGFKSTPAASNAQSLGAKTPPAVRASDVVQAGEDNPRERLVEGEVGMADGSEAPGNASQFGDMSVKEQEAMQQQIQRLAEQVKTLQDALEGTTGQPSPLVQPESTLSSSESLGKKGLAQQQATRPYLTTSTQFPGSQRILQTSPKAAEILKLAQARYRRSVQDLVKTAVELERNVPKAAMPLVASIEQQLVAVGQDAIHSQDMRILSELRRYKGGRLVELARGEVAPINDAMKQYRHSAAALANITNALERMVSPAVAHIAAMGRERLDVIAREAESEGDFRMRDLMTLTNAVPSDFEKRLPLSKTSKGLVETLPSGSTRVMKQGIKSTGGVLEEKENNEDLGRRSEKNAPVRRVQINTQTTPVLAFRKVLGGELPTHSQNTTPTPRHDTMPTPSQHISRPHDSIDSTRHREITIPLKPASRQQEQASNEATTTSLNPSSKQKYKVDGQPSIPSQNALKSADERTLLDELFPEATTASPSRYAEKREQEIPKLGLPKSQVLVSRQLVDRPKTLKEQVVESFQKRGEKITILQLEHCSTELTEADFRRLIPQGKHIESWNRDGEFYKVIPGRDPLSLERMPFYFLLFKSPESAHAYQNNATRLHKLTALHQPRNIFSAIPAPKGFLEDGEDINAATSSYLLKPTEHAISLRMVMQPYHPALRALIEQGGYNPIVPNVDEKKNRIYKILMHIEGYEPSPSDLFKIFKSDAYFKGMTLSLRNESISSVHRLRDLINLKTRLQPISTANPRAYGHWEFNSASPSSPPSNTRIEFDDPNIAYLMKSGTDGDDAEVAKEVNQIVMNRVYNRWIIDFDDEDQARRFAVTWHRRVLPSIGRGEKTWKDYEEVRMCNCELLW